MLPIAASAFCVALAVAAALVLFAGVLRFGTPALSGLTTASGIDDDHRPVDRTGEFAGDERRIYCCARATAFADTVLEVRWYLGGAQVGGYSARFGELARSHDVRFLARRGNVAFFMEKPREGWLGGRYRAVLFVDGERVGEVAFTVEQSEGDSGLRVYREPSGAFSVGVPHGWSPADGSTLDGASAGFLAQGDGYPPRFVVGPTEYESAEPSYLNGTVPAGGEEEETGARFQAYSLGDTAAARREFSWEYMDGDEAVELRTVQVVAQGTDGNVYSLNCHSEASDFELNLPVFNAIVNSFRL